MATTRQNVKAKPSVQRPYQIAIYRVKLVESGAIPLESFEIETSADAVTAFVRLFDSPDREMLAALFLNTKGQPIGLHVISIGTVNYTAVHPREVFKAAILAGASKLILAHNHPSGCIDPSSHDRAATQALHKIGELMEMEVIDHLIIVSEEVFFSFRAQGFLEDLEDQQYRED